MPKLNPKNYLWEWERSAYPYYFYIFCHQWLYTKFTLPVYDIMAYQDGRANTFLDRATLTKAAAYSVRFAQNNPKFLTNWQNFVYQSGSVVHQVSNLIAKTDLTKLSNLELQKLFKQAYQAYDQHDLNVGLIRNTNRLIEQKLLSIYLDPSVVATLLSSTQKSLFTKENEDLLRVAAKVKKNPASKTALLTKHWQKYFYLPCGYHGEAPFKKSDFAKRLAEILANQETLAKFQNKLQKNIQARSALINKLKPALKTKRLIEFGSTCAYFKDFIRGNLNRLQYYNLKLFKEIARRSGNQWQAIAHLLPDEIAEIIINPRHVTVRDKMFLYSDKSGMHCVLGKKAKLLINQFKFKLKTNRKSAIQVSGTPANLGLARGEALIIAKKKTKLKLKSGYILFAAMTTPDLMPLMKKAGAIVTDEGGLTCHAAIVSRELEKPCVIGTKIATKIFKTGDLVEVNANEGIVKKIN